MDISGLDSVTTAAEMLTWLSENCITPIQPAMSGADFGAILQKVLEVSGGTGSGLVDFNNQTASYTLAIDDKAINMDVATANTLTIPTNSDAAFSVGTQIPLVQSGLGQTTLVAATGVTLNSADGWLSLRTQFSSATLLKMDTDTWMLSGDLGYTFVPENRAIKINLSDTSLPATSPGWNNNLDLSDIDSPLLLLTSLGQKTSWFITASLETPGSALLKQLTTPSFGNADFPDDVLASGWYLNGGASITFTLSSLNPTKTYTVTTCAADTATGDGPTKITIGSSSQVGASPDNIAVELTFTEVVTEALGNVSIVVDNTAGATYPLLNAIIIAEN